MKKAIVGIAAWMLVGICHSERADWGTSACAAADERTISGERSAEFISAFNKGDAKALAGFWTEDGDLMDQAGQVFKGRAAIEKLYAKIFSQMKGAKLNVLVTSKKAVGKEVILEDGLTEVSPADGGPGSVARFSAILVKKENAWYFESVRESIARPPTLAAHFDSIDWLIGEWIGEEDKGESAMASYTWAENQNFIVSSFATTLKGVPISGGTQWIGYDAVEKAIRSWTFYSHGGFGEGTWTVDEKICRVKLAGKSADGKKMTAINVITRLDADHVTFQVTQLRVGDQSIPDAPAVKLKRNVAK